MAKIMFHGICNGTQERVSTKTGQPYQVTSFAEVTPQGITTFDVFGDLGLPFDPSVRDYVLEGAITGLRRVTVVTGGKPAKQ